jgi:hypothetical protein
VSGPIGKRAPQGQLELSSLSKLSFPMIRWRRFTLRAQALRNVLDMLVGATDQVPKGRNNQEPGTEVPGKHIQRIESGRDGTERHSSQSASSWFDPDPQSDFPSQGKARDAYRFPRWASSTK